VCVIITLIHLPVARALLVSLAATTLIHALSPLVVRGLFAPLTQPSPSLIYVIHVVHVHVCVMPTTCSRSRTHDPHPVAASLPALPSHARACACAFACVYAVVGASWRTEWQRLVLVMMGEYQNHHYHYHHHYHLHYLHHRAKMSFASGHVVVRSNRQQCDCEID
jgi:hypothetical protein